MQSLEALTLYVIHVDLKLFTSMEWHKIKDLIVVTPYKVYEEHYFEI